MSLTYKGECIKSMDSSISGLFRNLFLNSCFCPLLRPLALSDDELFSLFHFCGVKDFLSLRKEKFQHVLRLSDQDNENLGNGHFTVSLYSRDRLRASVTLKVQSLFILQFQLNLLLLQQYLRLF